MSETIVATHQFTVWKSENGFCVTKYKTSDGENITIKGNGLPDAKNVSYKFTGDWVDDKYGHSFKAVSYEVQLPDTEKGVVSYLSNLKCGIGKSWGERIYRAFGARTWDVLEKNPERLLEIKGFGRKRLELLKERLTETNIVRAIMTLLNQIMEIPITKAERIAKHFGKESILIIQNAPYELCEVKGIGFPTVEVIAKNFHFNPSDKSRIQGCIFYVLESISVRGHVCYPKQALLTKVKSILNSGFDNEVVSLDQCNSELSDLIRRYTYTSHPIITTVKMRVIKV